jgi:hypothetical protein
MPVGNALEFPTWDISSGYAAEMIAVFVIVIAITILFASSARRRASRSARRQRQAADRQPEVAMPSAGC